MSNKIILSFEFQKEIDQVIRELAKILPEGEQIKHERLHVAGVYFSGRMKINLKIQPDYTKAFKCFYAGWHNNKCKLCAYNLAVDCYINGMGVKKGITTGLLLLKRLAVKYLHSSSKYTLENIKNKTAWPSIKFTKKQWKIINS